MTRQSKQADQLRRIHHWQAHVTAQKQSGLSRAEYTDTADNISFLIML